jgi:DNA-binding transcriptional LysR family regulator
MRGLDLNLLRVLDALMRRRSVTAAAQDLGLTQSSVSNCLNRLRAALDDRLLERQGNTMVPTRLAQDLWPEIAAGLERIDGGLATLSTFAPATATTGFRIGMDDYAVMVLGANLSEYVTRTAPGVHLEIQPHAHPGVTDPLLTGQLDLFVGAAWQPAPEFAAAPLFEEEFVGLVGAHHPLTTAHEVTMVDFLSHKHVLTSSRGRTCGNVDAGLSRTGCAREVSVVVPTFEAAARIAAGGQLIFCCGRRLAKQLALSHGLFAFDLPLIVPGFGIRMLWNRRDDRAPRLAWLRTILTSLSGQ